VQHIRKQKVVAPLPPAKEDGAKIFQEMCVIHGPARILIAPEQTETASSAVTCQLIRPLELPLATLIRPPPPTLVLVPQLQIQQQIQILINKLLN
jgi:hypothetical protein